METSKKTRLENNGFIAVLDGSGQETNTHHDFPSQSLAMPCFGVDCFNEKTKGVVNDANAENYDYGFWKDDIEVPAKEVSGAE